VAKLVLAAIAGVAVTAVQRHVRGHGHLPTSLERAQVLLTVAGALTMVLIDNSVARAFGVAGAASIVRFRTPVEDPTDASVLFLLMGLGVCSGVGAFGLVAAGAAVVCALLVLTSRTAHASTAVARGTTIDLVSPGPQFPADSVSSVFARHGVQAELAEWKQNGEVRVRYRALAVPPATLQELGRDLEACPGVRSVSWELRKSAG
jgi:uncharacterized membrane protein YhiD involved in acid resistance